ncbi:MAG: hypothetical protein QXU47_05950 [Candidatus Bathyarchaeia archaeon]
MSKPRRFTLASTSSDGRVEKRENLDVEQLIGEVYLTLRRLIEELLNIKEVRIEVENIL